MGKAMGSMVARAGGRSVMQDYYLVGIVNAAYDLSETDHEAMRSIARAAANLVPRGPVIVSDHDGETPLDSTRVWFERTDERDVARFAEWQRMAPAGIRQLALSLGPRAVQLRAEPGEPVPAELQAVAHPRFPLCILASTGDGRGLHIAFGDPDLSEWRPTRLVSFHQIALHLAAAWRLRRALNAVTAVFAPAAGSHPSEASTGAGATTSPTTPREALRRAIAAHGRACDPRGATEDGMWPALVAGRWSLIDSFTAAGTKYLVAHENPPGGEALRALSWRERSALDLALAGRSGKWIGVEMGLSESVVTRTLRAALRKIGAEDAAAVSGVRNARFEPFDGLSACGHLAIARLTPPVTVRAASLSDAECAIVKGLLGGKRIAAIARERGTSPRTVAHQITSTYQKLGVSSRRELLALFA
jgi:DNA-binding NarL/FixJ family response regulator